MVILETHPDIHRFVEYYESQAGGSLPGFHGTATQYGRGLGSIFAKLFRFVTPLLRRGFSVAKPHLQTAAKNIVSDVAGRVMERVRHNANSANNPQQGSGLMVLTRRPFRRPTQKLARRGRARPKQRKKRRSASRKRSVPRRKRRRSTADIFS